MHSLEVLSVHEERNLDLALKVLSNVTIFGEPGGEESAQDVLLSMRGVIRLLARTTR
jgi:hypothetical protein